MRHLRTEWFPLSHVNVEFVEWLCRSMVKARISDRSIHLWWAELIKNWPIKNMELVNSPSLSRELAEVICSDWPVSCLTKYVVYQDSKWQALPKISASNQEQYLCGMKVSCRHSNFLYVSDWILDWSVLKTKADSFCCCHTRPCPSLATNGDF